MNSEPSLWLKQLQNGDLKVFDLVYRQYSERLYGFAFSILKNHEDSKEIVQETFLKLWNKRAELRSDKSLKSYLFTISYNISIDIFRKRLNNEKYQGYLKQQFSQGEPETENLAHFNELNDEILRSVDDLPEQRRLIFKLSREQGLSHAEIAEQLGISPKTVENQINLALRTIRKNLESGGLGALLFLFLFM